MPDITFLAFNYENISMSGGYSNGPGICLVNFVKDLRKLGVDVQVFSKLKSNDPMVKPLDNVHQVEESIRKSAITHHWTGIFDIFAQYLSKARNKKFVGPNVMDGGDIPKEKYLLSEVQYDHFFVVNEQLKFSLSKIHNIDLNKMSVLMVGPDQELWAPSGIDNGMILWKGNCNHKIKDVGFGLEVAKKLSKYKFLFLGYPNPYDYNQHIKMAKECHIYFSTSVSETMGMALCESLCSGLPSVTHPKIHFFGENYKTGIITNRNIESYCSAIEEIMEDSNMHSTMRKNGPIFIKNFFSNVASDYVEKFLGK